MNSAIDESADVKVGAIRLFLAGQLQGLGVRPAVARLAEKWRLGGEVCNTRAGLEIEVEGAASHLAGFRRELASALPRECRLDRIVESNAAARGRREFAIMRNEGASALSAPIPRDRVTCPSCLDELSDVRDRRHDYPLTSCADCGPRYSIIAGMPYERDRTAMADFPFCKNCLAEYTSPADRRFHAQAVACSACGPNIWAQNAADRSVARGADALSAAAAALAEGKIVALRGVGGYQLLCDATNDDAVRALRRRKMRPAKPLAVMAPSLSAAERWAKMNERERSALTCAAGPIVLLRARAAEIPGSIAPGLDCIGMMLPMSALHHLLAARAGRFLVCTSGNLEGEPLEYDAAAAQARLAGIADLCVHHDRRIVHPIDDSVVKVVAGRPVTIRLGRGLAPLPLDLPTGHPILALGAHLKAAAAWCNGAQSVLGPHVGDMDGVASRERLISQCAAWQSLYAFDPECLACDLHPDYFTTQWAAAQPRPTVGVQHHFAHVVSGMLEHNLLDRRVLGVSWDGTGWGMDGEIWGGEFLIADGARSFRRFAHLRPFALLGGDAAVHEPWRVAAAVLDQATGRDALLREGLPGVDRQRLLALLRLLDRPALARQTTSAGRLFDAAAAMILGIAGVQYEGQAAMMLEARADTLASGEYAVLVTDDVPMQLDWRPLFRTLAADRSNGISPGTMAMRFHRGLANAIVEVAGRVPHLPIVLSGGAFQNRLLTELVLERIDRPVRVHPPGVIPPNDGGLAAGQLAVAVLNRAQSTSASRR